MFRTRVLSSIVLVAIILTAFLCGGIFALAVTAFAAVAGLFELYRVIGIERSPMGVAGLVLAGCYYLNLYFSLIHEELLFFIIVLTIFLFFYVLKYPRYTISNVAEAFFGFVYVAVMLSFLYRTRALYGGEYYVWLIFLCSWGCDTAAYCVGKMFGKHHMTPELSPHKTIEGAVGGILGSALFVFIFGILFLRTEQAGVGALVPLVAGGALCAAVSMIGDLAASAIKRNFDIKDYGKLIPGHGGILDRFDSVIIVSPIIYYICSALLLLGMPIQ